MRAAVLFVCLVVLACGAKEEEETPPATFPCGEGDTTRCLQGEEFCLEHYEGETLKSIECRKFVAGCTETGCDCTGEDVCGVDESAYACFSFGSAATATCTKSP